MLPVILFYIFSAITVFSAIAVISARNSVHSVLFLILAFFNVAGLFLLLGAEFLAMLLVIVYVGAVAILFLFIVMMLNIDTSKAKEGFIKYLPIGIVVAATLFAEIFATIYMTVGDVYIPKGINQRFGEDVSNTEMLGNVIYTENIYLFQLAGLILLVAMIGAIVLTHRTRKGVRKQVIREQVSRNPKTAVKLVKVESGKGVE